jgi:hypothetical protein
MNDVTRQKLDEIERLEAQKAELMQQLHRSFALQDLWPEAFDEGTVTSQLGGVLWTPREMTFTVRRSDGVYKTFRLVDEVPPILWEGQIRELIEGNGGLQRAWHTVFWNIRKEK